MIKAFEIELTKVMTIDSSGIPKEITKENKLKKMMSSLQQEIYSRLHNVIRNYLGIFMTLTFDIGYTKIVEHQIKTQGEPISQNL